MDKTSNQLLADLILDVKKDVKDMRQELLEAKEIAVANSVILDEHMRRSEASEARLDVQESKLEDFMDSMEPVKEHVKTVHALTKIGSGVLKVLSVAAALLAAVVGLLKLLKS